MIVFPDTSANARLELEAAIGQLDHERVGQIRWFIEKIALGDARRAWYAGTLTYEAYSALSREWYPVMQRAESALKDMHTPLSKGVVEQCLRQIAALTDLQIDRLVSTRPIVNRYVRDVAQEAVMFIRGARPLREEVKQAMSTRAWPPVRSAAMAWELGSLAAWAANSRLCSLTSEQSWALGAAWWDAVLSE